MNPKMTTTYYKVLEAVYDNQVNIGGNGFCPLSQEEIALVVSCNRMTVNTILKELRRDGYIAFSKKQKYVLTELGIETVEKAKDIK